MSPSRGLFSSFHNHRIISSAPKPCIRRWNSTFAQLARDETRPFQVYISRSDDPYLNLSIEHYLLQKTPAESTILFLYTNKPCIVFGRNQNPWVEVNLKLLASQRALQNKAAPVLVDLVRRRSGGGTVFHDDGNVNYSVICPTSVFDRDRHAEMVVRALRRLGVDKAKVNDRHDIILEGSNNEGSAKPDGSGPPRKPFKISGSAYKLTRLRSVHHGTCLLSSPNLKNIGKYLRSPAKPYIKARGVDSVSSPITNVNLPNEAFEDAVVEEFGKLYNPTEPMIVSKEAAEVPEIAIGLAELKSLEWIYDQTPQFTFSTQPMPDDPRERPTVLVAGPSTFELTVRNGKVLSHNVDGEGSEKNHGDGDFTFHDLDWARRARDLGLEMYPDFVKWLMELLGRK